MGYPKYQCRLPLFPKYQYDPMHICCSLNFIVCMEKHFDFLIVILSITFTLHDLHLLPYSYFQRFYPYKIETNITEGQLELWVCSLENCPVQREAKSPRESKLLTILLLFCGLLCAMTIPCHSLIGLEKLSPRFNSQ